MEQNNEKYDELIKAFHLTWDAFPGTARLIDKCSRVLAVNRAGGKAGFAPGQICAQIPSPENHRGCKKALTLATRSAQVDRPSPKKIRAWVPVEGYPEVVVHFSVAIPEMELIKTTR